MRFVMVVFEIKVYLSLCLISGIYFKFKMVIILSFVNDEVDDLFLCFMIEVRRSVYYNILYLKIFFLVIKL